MTVDPKPESPEVEMGLDRFAREGKDGYADPNGRYNETKVDLVQCGLLGFCGCGIPEESLEFMERAMSLLGTKDIWKHANDVFGSSGAAYFFFYWLDKEGYSEHGCALPGWLTEKGKILLADIREAIDTNQGDAMA